jgi:PAS domain S-box-containing protein
MDTKNLSDPEAAPKRTGTDVPDHGALFTELFNLSPTPYFLINPEGIICDLNISGAQLLGRERSRLMRCKLNDFITIKTIDIFEDFLRRVFSTRTKAGCQVTLRGENISESDIQLEGLVSKENTISFVTAVDITSRKQLEEAVQHERLLLRTLIDNLPDTLYIKDAEGRKIIANPADIQVMGYTSEEEVIGKTDLEIFQGEVGRRGYDDDQEVLISGHPILEREEDFYDGSGKQRWLLTSKIPIRNDQEKIIGLVGIGRDITARKQAEEKLEKQTEQLKEVNDTKDKFFSIIAHDLRSPLGTVISLIDMMISDIKDFDKEEIERFMGMIQVSSKQLFSLLENLLLWARNQRGMISFQPEIIDLQKKVMENINFVKNQAEKKRISITSAIQGHFIIVADKNMMDTILRNLLSNAIKFTQEKGSIVVSAASKKQFVEISVTDNGVGISQDNIGKIFSIAGKPPARGTAEEKGSGLGLILCREFVEKHSGRIWAESEPGKGSAFRFTMPMAI